MYAAKFWRRGCVALLGAILVTAPASWLPAQEAARQPERVAKVVQVRPGDAENVGALISSFGVGVQTSDRLGLITIAGLADDVARAEQAVRQIEQLSRQSSIASASDVDLTVHFLGIVDQDASPATGPLGEVVAELKKTFPFTGYRLLETIALRARVTENSEVAGFLPENTSAEMPPKRYTFSARIRPIQERDNSKLVRFDWVRAYIRMPIPNHAAPEGPTFTYDDIGINTALEMRDGQTVVVGKAGSTGESKGYLLVLTAKVVE
jgi:hypothetical protein